MRTRDARCLPGPVQEALRRKVVKAVVGGITQSEAARQFGVSRVAVCGWMGRWSKGGAAALASQSRGRPSEIRLSRAESARTVRLIVGKCPDQLRLPFALWTREAVRMLLKRKYGAEVSIWTVGRYLRRWGLTPQKPLRRAFEQDPKAVKRWLEKEYPAIHRQALRERAEIHWGDEMGLRSDDTVGRTYGLKGQTPVVPVTGQRFGCNMISTITNHGSLAFMVFDESLTAAIVLKFLKRLVRHATRKVFWIVDRHPAHRAAAVTRWLEGNRTRIERFYLPAYSPELNPDELLNQDVKANTARRSRPQDKPELVRIVRSYLRSTQRQPHIVRNYFLHHSVRYAA